jgi:hypothetical protein
LYGRTISVNGITPCDYYALRFAVFTCDLAALQLRHMVFQQRGKAAERRLCSTIAVYLV